MALFKFFRGKTPSTTDAVGQKDAAAKASEGVTADNTAKSVPQAKSAKSSKKTAASKTADKVTKTPKTEPKPQRTFDPQIQGILEKSEKIALIAVLQTADNISDIGQYSHYQPIDETAGIHYFESTKKSYVGWKWAVTLSQLDLTDSPEILEVNLVAGPEAIEVPKWVPFKDRLKPSDISETDSLPYEKDDPRLESFFERLRDKNGEKLKDVAVERMRVLTPYGKADLAARWYEGNHGPLTASTRIAKAECMSCAFYIPLSGDLGQLFGVCANSWSRDDGRVVSSDHGCGMHSETDAKTVKRWKSSEFVVDQVNSIEIESSQPTDESTEEPGDDASNSDIDGETTDITDDNTTQSE